MKYFRIFFLYFGQLCYSTCQLTLKYAIGGRRRNFFNLIDRLVNSAAFCTVLSVTLATFAISLAVAWLLEQGENFSP